MERTAVNPWEWSTKLGYNQAEVISGATRQVICAGQTAVDENGAPQHPGNMRAQISLALDNLEAVLKGAGMDLSNVVKLGIYATDVDDALKNFDLIGDVLWATSGSSPHDLAGRYPPRDPRLDVRN